MNYKVYQGTELKQTVTSKTAVMNGLQPNRTYEFGVQPNDGNRDGTKVAKSVTTRGIRFNIPKTLMVGSTITLRYEEYPLGIVPIGSEPSGMFGGGNKQNLSAKVISMSNGSSVVEVAGNVIDIGGDNLIVKSELTYGYIVRDNGGIGRGGADFHSDNYIATNGETVFTLSSPDYVLKGDGNHTLAMYDSDKHFLGWQTITSLTQTLSKPNAAYIRFSINFVSEGGTYDHLSDWLDNHRYKLEQGDIATPYAAFVDGDTFAAQPDGTYALFSEYKALYY